MKLRAHLIGAFAALLACGATGAQGEAASTGAPNFGMGPSRVLYPQAHVHPFTGKTWFAPGFKEAIRTGAANVLYVNDGSGDGSVVILSLKKNGVPGQMVGVIQTSIDTMGGIAVDAARNVYVGGVAFISNGVASQEIVEFPPGSSTPSNTMNYTWDGISTCCNGYAIAVDASTPANVYSNAYAYNASSGGYQWGTLEWTGGSPSPTNFIYNGNNTNYGMLGLAVDGSDNVLATQEYCCDNSGYVASQLEGAPAGSSSFTPTTSLSANTYPFWLTVNPQGDLQVGDLWQWFGCPSTCFDVVATYAPGSTTATSSFDADFGSLSAAIGPKDLTIDMNDRANCFLIQTYGKSGKLLQLGNSPVCAEYMAVSPAPTKGTWGN